MELPEYLRDLSTGVERVVYQSKDTAWEDAEAQFYKDNAYQFTNVAAIGDAPHYLTNETINVIDEYQQQENSGENYWLDKNIELAENGNRYIDYQSRSSSNSYTFITREELVNRLKTIKRFGYTDRSKRYLPLKEEHNRLIYKTIIQQLQKLKPEANKQLLIARTIENAKLLTR